MAISQEETLPGGDGVFDKNLKEYLFTAKPVTDVEKGVMGKD